MVLESSSYSNRLRLLELRNFASAISTGRWYSSRLGVVVFQGVRAINCCSRCWRDFFRPQFEDSDNGPKGKGRCIEAQIKRGYPARQQAIEGIRYGRLLSTDAFSTRLGFLDFLFSSATIGGFRWKEPQIRICLFVRELGSFTP